MASSYTSSLAGLIKLNDRNLADFEATEIVRKARLFAGATNRGIVCPPLPMIPASNGTLHKYNREDVAPGVGFREIGAGLSNVARKVDTVTVTLEALDATVRRDKLEAMGYKDGPEAFMRQEIAPSLAQALFEAETQFLNGTNNEALGFTGLYDALESAMTVDAGGDGGERVYIVYATPQSVACVLGQDGEFDVGDMVEGTVLDDDGDPYSAWIVSILGHLGSQIATPTRHLSAITNLDSTATHLLTRDRVMDALTLIREQGEEPTHVIMSATMQNEYRESLEDSAYAVTDTPWDIDGVPIARVNSLLEDDASS